MFVHSTLRNNAFGRSNKAIRGLFFFDGRTTSIPSAAAATTTATSERICCPLRQQERRQFHHLTQMSRRRSPTSFQSFFTQLDFQWSNSVSTSDPTKRYFSGESSNPSSHKNEEPKLLYRAPMGDLVTRLKRISITSCLVSIIGLPLLVYLKNGTWPDAKQIGMGGFAFVSATGSTLALHFVFGPYVLELCEIPIRKCHNDSSSSSSVSSNDAQDSDETSSQRAAQEYLYQATTRSILGLKRHIVFDPLTDVTKYAGARPFANFIAKEKYVLYCHPELLDEETQLKLLNPTTSKDDDNKKDSASSSSEPQVRRPVDEQDGFL